MKNIIETLIGSKKRYNNYKKAKAALPENYRFAMDALEKYMFNFAKGDGFMVVLENVLHLFQESAIENVSVKEIIGEDPVEFADAVMAQYPEELWIVKIRTRLVEDIKKIGE